MVDAPPPPLAHALRRGGRLVLAYLDVGTIEPGRSWYRRARPYRLDRWARWGEFYAAVDRPGYRRLIARSVAPALLAKGFDEDVTSTYAPGRHRSVRVAAARTT